MLKFSETKATLTLCLSLFHTNTHTHLHSHAQTYTHALKQWHSLSLCHFDTYVAAHKTTPYSYVRAFLALNIKRQKS